MSSLGGTIPCRGKQSLGKRFAHRCGSPRRRELLAVIVGLESLKKPGYEVLVVSDSKYVVDAVSKRWVFNWEKKNFKGKKNPDLWKRFLKIYPLHNISFRWIKGHAGHAQNEICDQLAVMASENTNLLIDKGYEEVSSNQLFN